MRVAVFCGSRSGASPAYRRAAEELGALLVQEGMGLVFGGGAVGLMGVVSAVVHEAGGEVIGVIPGYLARRELAYTALRDLRIVETMHERKAAMADLSDAFVAMPGGIGTLEEFFEVWTWAQLEQHSKPCCLLNVDGYYDRLLGFVEHMIGEGFLPGDDRVRLIIEPTPARLMARLLERLAERPAIAAVPAALI